MKKRLLACLLVLPLIITGCSAKYMARQGSSKYQTQLEEQVKLIAKKDNVSNYYVTVSNVEYVILFNSNEKVETSEDQERAVNDAKNKYFYKAAVTVTYDSYVSTTEEYFCWTKGDKFVSACSESIYTIVYENVSDGSLNGEIGTL